MKRVAGVTIEGDRASLVVLARDGATWRVENVASAPPTFWTERAEIERPSFPVVLDASAWTPTEAATSLRSRYANRLRAAGWDVRPPMWTADGRAANPSDGELFALVKGGAVVSGFDVVYPALNRPLALACYGATHETTAEPPCDHPATFDRNPPVCTSCGAELGAVEQVATAPVWEHGEVAAAYGVEPEPAIEDGRGANLRPSPDWRAIAEMLAGALRADRIALDRIKRNKQRPIPEHDGVCKGERDANGDCCYLAYFRRTYLDQWIKMADVALDEYEKAAGK